MSRAPRAALLLAFLLLAPRAATARSLAIESFDADVAVLPSGTIVVTETIRPRFEGAWQGLYRTIPVDYRTPQGFSYRLDLRVEKVADETGAPLRWESSRERHYRKLKIHLRNAQDVTRTLTVRYRVENALRFFEDHDELYWNVTGDEWDVPIESSTATIALPPDASGVRAAAFTGAYGSQAAEADVETVGAEVRVRLRRPLAFREGMTVVVGWDKGFVREPTALERAWRFLRANLVFALPIFVLAGMWTVWSRYGRDPRLRPIAARYEPPDGLTPAEAGALVDHSADMRDVTATIVDLAVRGFLVIEEREEPQLLGLWTSKDYSFRLARGRDEWTGLRAHERALLEALFSGRLHGPQAAAVVTLADLKNRFYRDLPGIRDAILDALVGHGYYPHRPDRARKIWMGIGGGLAVLGAFAAAKGAAPFGFAPAAVAVSFGLSGLVVAAFGWFMPARTPRGAAALEQTLGFSEFLERVEAERLDRMMKTPETFEKCLPYAMAFGVESNWVRAFEDVYREPPSWYRGGSMRGFGARGLVNDLSRMSTATAAVMASAPRSSGGSGFGGGGRSGGGFGGGGGGGF